MVGGALGHGLVVKIVMLRTESSSLLSRFYSTLWSTLYLLYSGVADSAQKPGRLHRQHQRQSSV